VLTTFREYRFRPRLVTTLAAVTGIALTLAAAGWQLGRAHEKEAARARLAELAREPPVMLSAEEVAAGDVAGRRVTVRGHFVPRHGIFLDNRVLHGVVGFHVVMPLAIGGGPRHVLVDRGWIAATGDRRRLPAVTTPEGSVEITGRAVVPGRRFLELTQGVVEGNVWQNLTIERYRSAVPLALQPVLIQQENALDDGLAREWAPADLGVDKHYGYAFQWLALAVTILVFYLATHVRRAAPQAKSR
jgi:surfeit locus 1 family protein